MQNLPSDARHTEQIEAHGLSALRLRASGSEAVVYLHGAHVASFRTQEHGELLWMSSLARFAADKAIRGGVPLCFPWFGAHASRPELAAHGFARTSVFRFVGSELRGDSVVAELALASSDATLPLFPHAFSARLLVHVGRELRLTYEVDNGGPEPFDYELALHTYLDVSDVREVELLGLEGAPYVDKVQGGREQIEGAPPLRFDGETDRVYDSDGRVTLVDRARRRRVVVDKINSRSTVVWNPWSAKAARLADVDDAAWPGFLCVEAGNVGARAVRLAPDSRHATTTIISAETL